MEAWKETLLRIQQMVLRKRNWNLSAISSWIALMARVCCRAVIVVEMFLTWPSLLSQQKSLNCQERLICEQNVEGFGEYPKVSLPEIALEWNET